MKKFTVLILFVFLFFVSTLDAFSKSRFYDLPYGDYKCFKDGETCDYSIYEGGSGGQGGACPITQRGVQPDVYDAMADFLSSKYCYFTPTRMKKYNCYYPFGHITVYRKDGKVTMVSGHFPRDMKMQDTYQPEKCTEVPMKGGGNLPVHQKPANSHNFGNVQNSNFNTIDNSSGSQVSQNFFQTFFLENMFSIAYLGFIILTIAFIIYVFIFTGRTNQVLDKANKLSKETKYGNNYDEQYKYNNIYADSYNYVDIKQNPNIINMLFKIKLIVAVLASLIIIYFHPTEEALKCNESGICNINRTYFGIFNIKKYIKVNYNSCLSCSYRVYSSGKRRNSYGLYIRIDGKEPFLFYVDKSLGGGYSYQMRDLEKSCNKQVQKFDDYKNYSELYQYTIKSKASVSNLIISIIFVALFIFFIFLDDIGKYNKNRKKYY